MIITVESLQSHIDRMNLGHLNFSEIELNNRADLVRFMGYSIQDAVGMTESRMYRILEADGDVHDDDKFENEYNLKCATCNQLVKMTYTDNPSDGYILECEDGHYGFISVHAIDAMNERLEFEREANEEVKTLYKDNLHRRINKQDINCELIRNNGRLIQKMEGYNQLEFYEYESKFYCFENGSDFFELYPK